MTLKAYNNNSHTTDDKEDKKLKKIKAISKTTNRTPIP